MPGLSFLSPLFLVGALAAAIPIALHLFYRRAEPIIDFAAMRYLRQTPVQHSRRRRLRELILLALRVTALVLLACAFARPYINGAGAAASAPATIALIDTSASLSAPGAFDRVRERAAQIISSAPPTHAVGVVAFSSSADVIAPVSSDRAGALVAIKQLSVGAGATRYQAALERAAEECGGRTCRIVVISDLQQSGWDAGGEGGIPPNAAIEVETIDGPAGNLALASLRVESADAVATVQNFSQRAATEQVVFAVDERRIGAVPVVVPPGGTAEARLSLGQTRAGALSASISDRDGYRADNVRFAVLDAANAISVLMLTATGHPSEALYLERALAISDGVGGFRFRSTGGAPFSALAADALDDVDVIAVLGTRGLERQGQERLAAFVESGGGLLIAAGPDVEPAVVARALTGITPISWRARPETALSFAPADGRHPVFRVFEGVGTLGNVTFTRAALVDARDGGDVIARYSDGTPALVEERTRGGRVLMFGSDLNSRWNDFPLQPAFVPFVHETLRYLASARSAQTEFLVGDLPGVRGSTPGVTDLPVGRATAPYRASAAGTPPIGSPGEPDRVRPTVGRALSGAPGTRRGARRVAVNVDPRESDPKRMDVQTFQSGVSRLKATAAQQAHVAARRQEDDQGLWRYGLIMMVISLAAEGLLGRRLH